MSRGSVIGIQSDTGGCGVLVWRGLVVDELPVRCFCGPLALRLAQAGVTISARENSMGGSSW